MKLEMLILAAKSCVVYFKGKWIMSRIGKNEVSDPEVVMFSIGNLNSGTWPHL